MTRGKLSPEQREKRLGAGNGNAKLTDADVLEIRRARRGTPPRLPRTDPRSTGALAARFGVTPAHISKLALCHQWTHVLGKAAKPKGG